MKFSKMCKINLRAFVVYAIYLLLLCASVNAADVKSSDKKSTDTQKLFELTKLTDNIILDIKYATPDNFTKQVLYDEARFFLRESTAKKFLNAVKDFEKMGYKVRVFDGYRPLSVQKKMWKILPDEKFVADPAKGSRHNRGGAVDMTLTDKNGKDINMGTPYDDFTEKAHPLYKDFPADVLKNREIIKSVMEKNGFSQFPTEWWHYDDKDWEKFGIIDKDFSQIETNNK